ncbi:MAB_1171c family putative transporter, partial [Amycolatopsis sp. NPDC059090]|uniref:MAB_1171c family putative transporter n=1 Tax=Amycolatopsis sp. NPDC059090 TaxID=3346723 RepID=UPI00366AD291
MTFAKAFLWIALLWFLCRLSRAPRNPALWAVFSCVVLKLLSAPSTILALQGVFGGADGRGYLKLIQNILIDVSWFALLLFFMLSGRAARYRVRIEIIALFVVVAVTVVAVTVSTPNIREHGYGAGSALPEVVHSPEVAVFYIVNNGYAAYAIIQAMIWALRGANGAAHRVRWGLRITAFGLAAMALTVTVRAIAMIIRWAGGAVSPTMVAAADRFADIGIPIFIAGVSIIGFLAVCVAFRVWLRHRRRYRLLKPLWEVLHEAFPGDALYARPKSRHINRLFLWRVHRMYWRRVVEIRDGLVQLSPYLVDCGYYPDDTTPLPAAAQQAHALRRPSYGRSPTYTSPIEGGGARR